MIQKRYEYFSSEGKQWTEWMDFDEDDSKLESFKANDKYQLKPKLLNDYRIV